MDTSLVLALENVDRILSLGIDYKDTFDLII